MRAVLPVVVAASLVTASTLPFTQAVAAVPPPSTTEARAGADVNGESLTRTHYFIGGGIILLIILLLLLLDDDDEEEPVSP